MFLALKLLDILKLAHRPLGMGTIILFSISSGENPCHNMAVNSIDGQKKN